MCLTTSFEWHLKSFYFFIYFSLFFMLLAYSVLNVSSAVFKLTSPMQVHVHWKILHVLDNFVLKKKKFWLISFWDVIFLEELMLFITTNPLCCLVYLFSSALSEKYFLQQEPLLQCVWLVKARPKENGCICELVFWLYKLRLLHRKQCVMLTYIS